MSGIRITARDAKDSEHQLKTATQFIWATLRTHVVMEEYLKKKFEDHPAFASVITRYVTHNNFKSDINDLSTRLDHVTRDVSNISKRVDTLLNRMDASEKAIKNKKDK